MPFLPRPVSTDSDPQSLPTHQLTACLDPSARRPSLRYCLVARLAHRPSSSTAAGTACLCLPPGQSNDPNVALASVHWDESQLTSPHESVLPCQQSPAALRSHYHRVSHAVPRRLLSRVLPIYPASGMTRHLQRVFGQAQIVSNAASRYDFPLEERRILQERAARERFSRDFSLLTVEAIVSAPDKEVKSRTPTPVDLQGSQHCLV